MNLKFEFVQNFTTAELLDVPKQQIIDCVLAALDGDGDKCMVFEFVFSHFTEILSLGEINVVICQQLLPPLKDGFDDSIAYAESAPEEFDTIIDELSKQIQTIFQLYQRLLDNVQNKFNEIDTFVLSDVENVLLNTLHFVNKTTTQQCLHSQHEIKVLLDGMQMFVTKVLTSPKFQLKQSMDELALCRSVLMGLVELGHQQSIQSDLKSMANTWKHLSKLAIDFHTVYNTQRQHQPIEFNAGSDDFLDWMTVFVQTICNLITKNVEKMLEMTGECQKEMIAITKINAFYQKLLQNLAKEYTNDEFRGQSHYIQLYEWIIETLDNGVDDDIRNNLLSLNDILHDVLANTFNCERFSSIIMNFHGGHIRLCLEIMKLLLQTPNIDNVWYINTENVQKNIFHHLLFVCIPKDKIQMCISMNLWNEVVYVCTALMLTNSENQQVFKSLEQILVEASLIDDPFRMPILLNIWILFIRHVSNESRFLYCKQFLSLNQNCSPIARTPNNILIKKVIKHALMRLSELQRSQLFRETSQNDRSNILMLDFDSATNGEISTSPQYGEKMVNEITETLTKLNPGSGIVSSSECLELIKHLASFQSPPSQRLLCFLNDPKLINSLTDTLFRSKTRRVDILLSTVLKMLLWQKYLCGKDSTSIEIDYSDSLEVRKCYALELCAIAKLCQNHLSAEAHSIFDGLDHLIKARLQKYFPRIKSSRPISCEMNEYIGYLNKIQQINRRFGCVSYESCLNQNVAFERCLQQIVLETKRLSDACANNPRIDLNQYSHEITYVNDLFSRLQSELR